MLLSLKLQLINGLLSLEYHQSMDYISNLPDAIISHILSFLPTKSAVKTCILSKRWQYAWTKVPALDFTELPRSLSRWSQLSGDQLILFNNFVNRVLLLNDVPCLQCFTLISYDDSLDYIESWFRSVAEREIYELDIEIEESDIFYLPRQFLSGPRLVVLKLKGWFVISDIRPSFHLPNLKIIHLVSIELDLYLERLILGCTALTELLIERCVGLQEGLYVESSTLESLEIINNFGSYNDLDPHVYIKAPNLRYLSLEDEVVYYDIGEMKLLTEANLDLWESGKYNNDIEYHTLQLVKRVSGVKSLRLGSSDIICCFEDAIPDFENLIELQLTADSAMYDMLQSAPNLKSLIIEKVSFVGKEFYSEVAPGCMSCLENVKIFLDKKQNIRLAKHILKVATALKKMRIYLHPMNIKEERAMYQSILNCPRSSPFCQVKVVHLDQ